MTEFAGKLGERIVIERATGIRDAMGVQTHGWEPVCSCLAEIVPETPGPEAEAMALSAMPRFRVTIRNRDGIAIDQRIRWKGRLMMVRKLLDDPRTKDRIAMRCEEVRG